MPDFVEFAPGDLLTSELPMVRWCMQLATHVVTEADAKGVETIGKRRMRSSG